MGILPALPETPGKRKVGKRERAQLYAARAIAQLEDYLANVGQMPIPAVTASSYSYT